MKCKLQAQQFQQIEKLFFKSHLSLFCIKIFNNIFFFYFSST